MLVGPILEVRHSGQAYVELLTPDLDTIDLKLEVFFL